MLLCQMKGDHRDSYSRAKKTTGLNRGPDLLCFRVFLEKTATEAILVMRVGP